MNFLSEEEETTATLERVENIRKLINNLIDAKIVEEVLFPIFRPKDLK
jgi:prolyl-tRNA synthetase